MNNTSTIDLSLKQPYSLGYEQKVSVSADLAARLVKSIRDQLQMSFKNPLKVAVDYSHENNHTRTWFHLQESTPKKFKFLYPDGEKETTKVLFSLAISSYGEWCMNDIDCKIQTPEVTDIVVDQLQKYAAMNQLVLKS